MKRCIQILTSAAAWGGVFAAGAHAQCSNALITSAFRLALNRVPTAAECVPSRFAGGAFSTTTDLVPLVKASMVCQDPWIAQAYYKLGRPLNGHDPTLMENGRPGSTAGQCNTTTYGSWPDFPTLTRNIQNYFTPVAAPVAPPAGAKAQITSATMMINQPAVIRWTYSGAPSTCGAGVFVRLNNGNWGTAANLAAGGATIDARYTNFAWPANTRVSLTLFDACTGQVITPAAYTATITAAAPAPAPPPPVPAKPVAATVNSFVLISGLGSRCLAVPSDNHTAGTRLIIWDCRETEEQRFTFMPDGTIRPFGATTNNCVDIEGGNVVAGAHPIIWACNGQPNQKFHFTNGRITTVNGLCLDMWGGWISALLAGSVNAQISVCNGGDNQRFVAAVVLPYGNSISPINPGLQHTITGPLTTTVIGVNGSAIVNTNGSNIVAQGAGNIVAQGAGNIVAQGAGNIVAQGAGNVIVPYTNGIVAQGAGN